MHEPLPQLPPWGSEHREQAKSSFSQLFPKRGLWEYYKNCSWGQASTFKRHLGLAEFLLRDLGSQWLSLPFSLLPPCSKSPISPRKEFVNISLHPSFFGCHLRDVSLDCLGLCQPAGFILKAHDCSKQGSSTYQVHNTLHSHLLRARHSRSRLKMSCSQPFPEKGSSAYFKLCCLRTRFLI